MCVDQITGAADRERGESMHKGKGKDLKAAKGMLLPRDRQASPSAESPTVPGASTVVAAQ